MWYLPTKRGTKNCPAGELPLQAMGIECLQYYRNVASEVWPWEVSEEVLKHAQQREKWPGGMTKDEVTEICKDLRHLKFNGRMVGLHISGYLAFCHGLDIYKLVPWRIASRENEEAHESVFKHYYMLAELFFVRRLPKQGRARFAALLILLTAVCGHPPLSKTQNIKYSRIRSTNSSYQLDKY